MCVWAGALTADPRRPGLSGVSFLFTTGRGLMRGGGPSPQTAHCLRGRVSVSPTCPASRESAPRRAPEERPVEIRLHRTSIRHRRVSSKVNSSHILRRGEVEGSKRREIIISPANESPEGDRSEPSVLHNSCNFVLIFLTQGEICVQGLMQLILIRSDRVPVSV